MNDETTRKLPLRFWVNSLGEYGRTTPTEDVYGGGSVNISDLGDLPEDERNRIVQERHDAVLTEFCTPAELDLYREFERQADAMPDSARWRFAAALAYAPDRPDQNDVWLNLSTEFKHWTDEEAWWERLREIAAEHGATVEEFFTDEERGYWKAPEGLPSGWSEMSDEEKRALPSYVPAKHEGRKTLQVSVDWNVHGKSPEDVKQIITRFEAATAELWEQAGVGVL
jgi:hypothetical protein